MRDGGGWEDAEDTGVGSGAETAVGVLGRRKSRMDPTDLTMPEAAVAGAATTGFTEGARAREEVADIGALSFRATGAPAGIGCEGADAARDVGGEAVTAEP